MIITTSTSNGQTFYEFSKGRFSYTTTRRDNSGLWDIITTDNSKTRPDNLTMKCMHESEMKAKIWQAFFALVNCDAVAA